MPGVTSIKLPSRSLRNSCRRTFTAFLTLTMAGIFTTAIGYWQFRESIASKTWPVVSGTVVESRVRDHHNSDNTTVYQVDVRYEYTIEDIRYTGNQVSLSDINYVNLKKAKAVVSRYPVGQTVEVHYDPVYPGRAVLETGVKGSVWAVIGVGCLLTLMGMGAVKFLLLR